MHRNRDREQDRDEKVGIVRAGYDAMAAHYDREHGGEHHYWVLARKPARGASA